MKFFPGLMRKLSLLPLSAVAVGWMVYLVGFTLFMVNKNTTTDTSNFDRLPYFISVSAPPVLVILALLHAAFSGLVSSILGLVASLLSVICFSSVGYVLYTCALDLYASIHDGKEIDIKCVLMFVGTLVMSLSWTVILMSWSYFTYEHVSSTDQQASGYVVDEDGTVPSPPATLRNPPPFAGIARKLAGVLLVLKTGSWCLLITGIDSQIHANSSAHDDFKEIGLPFGTWTVCTIGALLVISAAMHAAANGGASVLMGVMTSLLSMLYLICVGHLVHSLGIKLYHRCHHRAGGDCSVNAVQLYQLCGGLGTGVFWACVLALWPFYYKKMEKSQRLEHSLEQRRDYLFQNQDSEYERLPLVYKSNKPTIRSPSVIAPDL